VSTEQDGRTDELQPGQPPIGRGHGPAADARTIGLAVGALGVVFGDIGTNPLAAEAAPKLGVDLDRLSYFLGRESLRVTARPGMVRWREHLFALMSRNAPSAATYFDLPPEQIVEVGLAVEL
jgi:K+ transporter